MLNVSVPRSGETATDPFRFSCLRVDAGHAVRVVVTGELDVATAPRLDDALRRAEADARLIVVDLRGLDFMDCSGLRVLLEAERRARRPGGRLVVVRGPAAVARLIALADVDRVLELVDRLPPWAARQDIPA